MLALTVAPGEPGSGRLDEVPEPAPTLGAVLIEALAVGVCGTDREIIGGQYGKAPANQSRLVIGHESLGRVANAPAGCGLRVGDWVCCMVRCPDPVPCASCARGEWDMCQNGGYTEHGINGLDGFASVRYRADPHRLVRVPPQLGARGVLIEPTSVVAKAWDHIERIGRRSTWTPRRVLVTGAGPIGLLAALLGVQRGLEVHVLDRVTSGLKPQLAEDLGATYHTGAVADVGLVDVVLECTGAPQVVLDAIGAVGPNGMVCLTGVSSGGRTIPVDAGALNRNLVLENNVVFGSVNANATHYALAVEALCRADPGWLDRMMTRRVPLLEWPAALQKHPDDVKTVIIFA